MLDQLEHELRQLIIDFEAAVRYTVLRSLQAALLPAPGRGEDLLAVDTLMRAGAEATARIANGAAAALAAPRPGPATPRPKRTAQEMERVRTQVTAIIHQHPGQSTAELACAVGIPSSKLRPQLRQLADAGVISIQEHDLGGVKRHTYRAAEIPQVPRAEVRPFVAGAAA